MSYPNKGRNFPKAPVGPRINQQIRSAQVRLIDSDGSQLGIKGINEAIAAARAKNLDLVEVAPKANPPVCKILDFSKFKYEQDKKQREARKNQKAGLLKEVRLSPVIGAHDLDVKLKHAEEFLKAHDKVRITVVFRGRQMQHQEIGQKLLRDIQERLSALAVVEQAPASERNRLMMTLTPKH
jgi:translation initiation factor IF-3